MRTLLLMAELQSDPRAALRPAGLQGFKTLRTNREEPRLPGREHHQVLDEQPKIEFESVLGALLLKMPRRSSAAIRN